ncbi:hypothetical protein MTP02_50970 [Streptomyces albus]|nr:hypothetical protein MTP02_50970 [Streptomyces albus]
MTRRVRGGQAGAEPSPLQARPALEATFGAWPAFEAVGDPQGQGAAGRGGAQPQKTARPALEGSPVTGTGNTRAPLNAAQPHRVRGGG